MKNKLFITLLVTAIAGSSSAYAQSRQQKLNIYLPREITIEGDCPTIGQVAILTGNDELASKAAAITVGRISTPDQTLVVNKNIILSRIASNGIASSAIALSGAQEVTIKRQNRVVSSQQFLQEADSFLKSNLPDKSICGYDALSTPANLIVAGAGDNINLECRLVKHSTQNQCKVQISAITDNKEIAVREVVFRLKYRFNTVKTKSAVAKGETITKENAQAQEIVSNSPGPAGWTLPFGLIATRSIPADTAVIPNMVSAPTPQVLLKRNQNVSIKIERGGLLASANGKVLQDGAVGECIKVQNVDSKVVIVAKVNEDGTVEPVF